MGDGASRCPQELQRAYVEAGSKIVYAPTFAANRISLANFGLESQAEQLNTRLVKISREAVEGRAFVAGDLTTTGQLMEPKGDMTYEKLYHAYQEQVRALADAGADLLVAETMLSVEETIVALDAAQSVCQLPVMCTLSLEADGTAMYGGNAVEAVVTLQEMGAAAVGLNCSVGPDQLESVIRNMKEAATVPVIAKPNAGMPSINEKGEAVYSMNEDDFARYTKILVEAGAGIVGGCCGTTPDYIRKLAQILGLRG
ncbi:MAG: homocysteine S-methyltransferase family protein [Lachnospiraceae bacterium]